MQAVELIWKINIFNMFQKAWSFTNRSDGFYVTIKDMDEGTQRKVKKISRSMVVMILNNFADLEH